MTSMRHRSPRSPVSPHPTSQPRSIASKPSWHVSSTETVMATDPKSSWQQQTIDAPQYTAAELRSKVAAWRRRVRLRNSLEHVASLVLVIAAIYGLLHPVSVLMTLANVALIAGAVF